MIFHPSIHPSISCNYPYVHPLVYPSINQSINQWINKSIHPSMNLCHCAENVSMLYCQGRFFHPPLIRLTIRIYPLICPSTRPFTWSSFRPSVRPSIHPALAECLSLWYKWQHVMLSLVPSSHCGKLCNQAKNDSRVFLSLEIYPSISSVHPFTNVSWSFHPSIHPSDVN